MPKIKKEREEKTMAKKFTTEERKHLVTRTFKEVSATVQVVNIAEKAFTEKTVKVSGNFEDNISLLAFIANRYNTKDELYVAILERKDRDVKYAMFDYDFMKNGFILNDDETEE